MLYITRISLCLIVSEITYSHGLLPQVYDPIKLHFRSSLLSLTFRSTKSTIYNTFIYTRRKDLRSPRAIAPGNRTTCHVVAYCRMYRNRERQSIVAH